MQSAHCIQAKGPERQCLVLTRKLLECSLLAAGSPLCSNLPPNQESFLFCLASICWVPSGYSQKCRKGSHPPVPPGQCPVSYWRQEHTLKVPSGILKNNKLSEIQITRSGSTSYLQMSCFPKVPFQIHCLEVQTYLSKGQCYESSLGTQCELMNS